MVCLRARAGWRFEPQEAKALFLRGAAAAVAAAAEKEAVRTTRHAVRHATVIRWRWMMGRQVRSGEVR